MECGGSPFIYPFYINKFSAHKREWFYILSRKIAKVSTILTPYGSKNIFAPNFKKKYNIN